MPDYAILRTDERSKTKSFVANSKQALFLYNKATHTLFAGGTRGGKTLALCYKALLLSAIFKNNRGLIGRQSWPALRDTTLDTMLSLLKELGWKYAWSEAKKTLSLWNGSKILFQYLEDFTPRMGLDLGFLAIDQIEDISENTFNVLLTRLSRHLIPTDDPQYHYLVKEYGEHWQQISFHTANPTPEDHWIYKRWKENDERRKVGHPRYNPRYLLVEVTADDNKPNLNEKYFEFFRDMPKNMVDRYRYGKWGGGSGKIYADEWNDDIHIISAHTPFPDNATFYRGYDHGGMSDPACCLFAYLSPNPYDGEIEVIVFDEYYGESLTPDQHAMNIIKVWQECEFFLNYADTQVKQHQVASKKEEMVSLLDIYRDAGLLLVPAFKPKFAGIQKVQRWMTIVPDRPHRFLKDAKGEPARGAPHLYIHQHCFHLIEEIKRYHMSNIKPGAIAEGKDDAVDALRFLLASELSHDGGRPVSKESYTDPLTRKMKQEFEEMEQAEQGKKDVPGDLPEYFTPEDFI